MSNILKIVKILTLLVDMLGGSYIYIYSILILSKRLFRTLP